jgi:hypothetical protein
MAVEYKYADPNFNTDGSTNGLQDPVNGGGILEYKFATVEIAAADSDGSKYIMFPNLPADIIPLEICVACDAITAGTVFDIGLYNSNLGTVVSAAVFASNIDLSSAVASLNPKTALDAMSAVPIENYGKRLWEHAGHTQANKKMSYDIVLTGDTVGTAAGTVSMSLKYLKG